MFGGAGISTSGLNIALLADLGQGEKLWLKANDETRGRFEAAGCEAFVYRAKGKSMTLNYYSAPEDAMESPRLMAQWARLALDCALKARSAKALRTRSAASVAKRGSIASKAAPKAPARPVSKRTDAAPARTKAARKSDSG